MHGAEHLQCPLLSSPVLSFSSPKRRELMATSSRPRARLRTRARATAGSSDTRRGRWSASQADGSLRPLRVAKESSDF